MPAEAYKTMRGLVDAAVVLRGCTPSTVSPLLVRSSRQRRRRLARVGCSFLSPRRLVHAWQATRQRSRTISSDRSAHVYTPYMPVVPRCRQHWQGSVGRGIDDADKGCGDYIRFSRGAKLCISTLPTHLFLVVHLCIYCSYRELTYRPLVHSNLLFNLDTLVVHR